MCGLILAPDTYSPKAIEDALALMEYRGANGLSGVAYRGGWVLGHVRLAIQTALDEGSQPFSRPGTSLAFVGEIFGAPWGKLLKPTGDWSEEEQLFSTLESPYLDDFHKLDGFWALAQTFDDGRARVLTDHLGIKPLYYWAEYGIVCSEIEPMFALERPPELDEAHLGLCTRFGFDCTTRTPYKGIVQVPPGTCVTFPSFDPHTPEIFNYWDWDKVDTCWGSLREHLDSSIRSRASFSNRDVAVLLSGGLDSSIVYYSLKSQGFEVDAYSVENGESEFLPPDADVTLLQVDPQISYSKAVKWMQSPLDLGSLFPQMQLSRALKEKGYNVCLTGDGADEVFGGYRRAQEYDSQASDVFCELPYYHLPRLDRIMMRSTIELRSPFLAPRVVATGLRLGRANRTKKQALKYAYDDLLPSRILGREKHPLKSAQVREDPFQHRLKLMEAFREHYNQLNLRVQ